MIIRYGKKVNPAVSGDERKAADSQAGPDQDACRCKETSAMTPRELLKLMVSDLSFWKKGKK